MTSSYRKTPPNRAIGLATAPVTSHSLYTSKLRQLGLSAPEQIPVSWDWREERKKGNLSPLTKPKQQSYCGNCWAMSSTASFADRWIIATNDNTISNYSFNPLLTTVCTDSLHPEASDGCGGGLPENCQTFFEQQGAIIDKSYPNCPSWEDYCGKSNPPCCGGCDLNPDLSKDNPPFSCKNLTVPSDAKKYKAITGTMKANTVMTADNKVDTQATINSIKTDILYHGPVVAKFVVWNDFINDLNPNINDNTKRWASTDNIYIHGSYNKDDANKQDGFHAVVIIGWGMSSKNIPYWIVKNSWGDWNKDGHFFFAMYTDNEKRNVDCGMDIPFMDQDQLFGGTISFVQTSGFGGQSDNQTKPSKSNRNWIWITIIIIALLLLIICYKLFK